MVDIQETILLAKAYRMELTDKLERSLVLGKEFCSKHILVISNLIDSLESRIRDSILDSNTNKLHTCLLQKIVNYSGMSLNIDPNASIPNLDIDVTIVGDNRPDWLDVKYGDMINEISGYKDTYFNASWVGWNPMIQIMGVVMYQVGVDYDNDGLGTITFKEGKGLYAGQYFRAGNFQTYTPPVTTFTYKLINNSTINTEYTLESVISPLTSGQTIENPVVLGASISADIQDGQTCIYTIYNSSGGVVFTSTIIGSASVNGLPMVADRSQEFLFFDSENNIWDDVDTWDDTNTWID